MRATGWWDERIVGGFMTYWLYQHIGNLSPQQLAEDDVLRALREADDGGRRLREFAFAPTARCRARAGATAATSAARG